MGGRQPGECVHDGCWSAGYTWNSPPPQPPGSRSLVEMIHAARSASRANAAAKDKCVSSDICHKGPSPRSSEVICFLNCRPFSPSFIHWIQYVLPAVDGNRNYFLAMKAPLKDACPLQNDDDRTPPTLFWGHLQEGGKKVIIMYYEHRCEVCAALHDRSNMWL